MGISNLKEEELTPRAKEKLHHLRTMYVGILEESRLYLNYVQYKQYHIESPHYEPTTDDWHVLRAYQIALAECQLSKIIKGE